MLTVKRYGHGHGDSNLGKPSLHPATVDLKGKAYEYVLYWLVNSEIHYGSWFSQLLWSFIWCLSARLLRQNATKFLLDDVYRNPGPLQFDGPGADAKPVTLCVEDQDYMGRIKKLQEYLDKVLSSLKIFKCLHNLAMISSPGSFIFVFQVRSIVKPGCSQDVLKAALSAMASVTDILSLITTPSSGNIPI